MEKNPQAIDKARKVVDLSNVYIIICNYVYRLVKRKKVKQILLVTEYYFYFLEKGKSNKLEVSDQFDWCDVKSITRKTAKENHSFLDITYKSTHIQITMDALFFIQLIMTHYVSVFPKSIPTLDEYLLEKIEFNNKKSNSLELQIRYRMHAEGNKLPKELAKALNTFRGKDLNLNSFPECTKRYTDLFLNCLRTVPITHLVLPSTEKPKWNGIATILKDNLFLISIANNDPFDSSVKKLAEALKGNTSSNLSEFTFINANISTGHLPILYEFLSSRPFKSISFNNSISDKAVKVIFKEDKITQSLKFLEAISFEKAPDISAKRVFKKLKNLKSYSFIDCNIDVVEVIHNINKLVCEKMTVIGGVCNNMEESVVQLKDCIASINFSQIKFDIPSFINAFSIFTARQSPMISLTMNKIKLVNNDWETASKVFVERSANATCLEKLGWAENGLESAFVTSFLPAAVNLKSLDLSASISERNVQTLKSSIVKLTELTELNISGASSLRARAAITPLFDAITQLNKLKILTVDSQEFGDKGLASLAQLLVRNKSIEQVSFKYNIIQMGKVYKKFFEDVMQRGPPLQMEFPEEDINALHHDRELDRDEINHMMDCHKIILAGNQIEDAIEVDDDAIDPANTSDQSDDTSSNIPANNEPIDTEYNTEDWDIDIPDIPETNNQIKVQALQKVFNAASLHKKLIDTLNLTPGY